MNANFWECLAARNARFGGGPSDDGVVVGFVDCGVEGEARGRALALLLRILCGISGLGYEDDDDWVDDGEGLSQVWRSASSRM